jgi:hypothetical protein
VLLLFEELLLPPLFTVPALRLLEVLLFPDDKPELILLFELVFPVVTLVLLLLAALAALFKLPDVFVVLLVLLFVLVLLFTTLPLLFAVPVERLLAFNLLFPITLVPVLDVFAFVVEAVPAAIRRFVEAVYLTSVAKLLYRLSATE